MGRKAFKGLLRWIRVKGSFVLITLMATGTVCGADGVSFLPRVDYAVGTRPRAAAVGDFNGDRILDLVVANQNSASVSILLGVGDGTFQPAVNFSVGGSPYSQPQSVAVGDFNGDGFLDLAVVNANSDDASVLLGNGDGTFQPATNFQVGADPYSVAVGDFNGDGFLDLVVANFSSNNISVLLGNGNGTFQLAVNYGVGIGPYFVAVGDFNGDSFSDLAVANDVSNNVSVLQGNGNGTFQPAVNFVTGMGPLAVVVGDFNGDGKLDLALVNRFSDTVSVLINNTPSP